MFGIKVISGKKFDEMEYTIRKQNSIIGELREELSNLKSGINCESVCGSYCEHCVYGLPAGETYYPVGFGDISKRKTFICSLAVPCKCEHCEYGLPVGDISKRKTFICSLAVPCKKFTQIVRE